MIKTITYIFILLKTFLNLYAQSVEIFNDDGTPCYKYTMGIDKYEGKVIKCKREGEWKEYRKGKLYTKSFYKNDKLNGTTIVYDKNGLKEREISYLNGIEHGERREYYRGKLVSIRNLNSGKREGLSLSFYSSDTTATLYKNDFALKSYYLWTKKVKKIKTERIVINDSVYIKKDYSKNGNIKLKSKMLNGFKNGEITFYHNNGNLKETSIFKKGKRNGSITLFHSDGIQCKMKGQYISNKRNGKFIYYDTKGKKIRKEYYENDIVVK